MISRIFANHPILRGMASYAVLYPGANATQQYMSSPTHHIDWKEVRRFALFGSCIVAPTMYTWVKLSAKLFNGMTWKHAISKAVLEQLLWAPFAISQFYIGINLMEGKSLDESIDQLKKKFIRTWQVGSCFWPLVQTFNFRFVPERNRVPVISVCSYIWNVFMSYMHHKQPLVDN